jgi:hypothetical protein
MPFDVLPDCHLGEGVEAQPFAFAEVPESREFLLAESRNHPIQTITPRFRDVIWVDECFRMDATLDTSAHWIVPRHYYIVAMS